ncbi:hypothetical protein VTJ49DRAFT_2359 [Mycothermus thermophilus]|uniref:EKC/KEOPS complex subunit GON7 n=1 Tax=Humicola insolens TaxID=85995 RepID=A0ABR3VQW1_HUMIN
MAPNQQSDNASSNHTPSQDATTSSQVSVNDHLAQVSPVPFTSKGCNPTTAEAVTVFSPVDQSRLLRPHSVQALRELARGEQTASTLEANLTNLESKLDAILASLLGDGFDEGEDKDNDEHPQQGQQQEKAARDASRKQDR